MDPWKVSTAALGTLSAVLLATLIGVWTTSSPEAPAADPVVDVDVRPELDRRDDLRVDQADPRDEAARDVLEGLATELGPTGSGDTPAWVSDPSVPLPDAVVERAREQLRAEAEERRFDRRDQIRDEIDAFLADEGVDAETSAQVNALIDDFSAKMETLREQVRSGELERYDVRGQVREERMAMRDALDQALGPEVAERLRDRLPGAGRGPGDGSGRPTRPGRGM